MRSVPAAWQAAADAQHALGSFDQRLVVQMQIHDDKWLWLSFVKPGYGTEEDSTLALWESQGAWSGTEHFGPYDLLKYVPDLTAGQDMDTMVSLSAVISGMRCLNHRHEQMGADLGAYRISEIRQLYQHSFKDREVKIHAAPAGVDWADRMTWTLRCRGLTSYDEVKVGMKMSESLGEGDFEINQRITSTVRPEVHERALPIVIGGGHFKRIRKNDIYIFASRDEEARTGGGPYYCLKLRADNGAPWTGSVKVAMGSKSQRLTGTTNRTSNATSECTFDSPGLERDPDYGEKEILAGEEGYRNAGNWSGSAKVRFHSPDSDFTYYVGDTVVDTGNGEMAECPDYVTDTSSYLEPLPRVGGKYRGHVYHIEGSGAGVAGSQVFQEFAEKKRGLSASQYAIEGDAGELLMCGGRDETVGAVAFLRAIDLSTRSRIIYDGIQLRMLKRRTATEIGIDYDFEITDNDLLAPWPQIDDLPAGHRLSGFVLRYNRKVGKPRESASAYQGKIVKGDGRGLQDERFKLDFVTSAETAQEIADFWYEMLGPTAKGDWPRVMFGVTVDFSYMQYEEEDIARLQRVDGEGNTLDGLHAGNRERWRVLNKSIMWPQDGKPGRIVFDLLEVAPAPDPTIQAINHGIDAVRPTAS